MVDLSENFPEAITAEADEETRKNVLILRKLDEPVWVPDENDDYEIEAQYELEYRWLSRALTEPDRFGKYKETVNVLGNDFVYVADEDMPPIDDLRSGKVSLFDVFRLFP